MVYFLKRFRYFGTESGLRNNAISHSNALVNMASQNIGHTASYELFCGYLSDDKFIKLS